MKKRIFSILFAILISTGIANAEFFSDIILTSPNAIWTDSRTYSTLQGALNAIGASERDLYIAREETVVTMTIQANVRLHFLKSGAIANSGQLTINTKQIIAKDQQIFTGAGDIDFAVGSTVRSSWFSDIVEAFDVTADDELTLVISKSAFITANCAVGNDVNLKWESPRNQLTANTGIELSNIKNIQAGNYQLFAGAGDFDFLAGTVVHSSWFKRLRSAVTFTGDENVDLTILVDQSEIIDISTTFDQYQALEIKEGCIVTIVSGQVLTINGPFIDTGLHRKFLHDNTDGVVFGLGSVLEVYPQWWDSVADGVSVDDEVAIQTALDASLGLICKLLPSTNDYIISNSVVIANGNRLIGSSTSTSHQTTIKLNTGVDDNVLESSTWTAQAGFCHWFEISNLSIDGNKANNASTSAGIAIYGMGENAEIHNVFIDNCNDYGVQLAGVGAPSRLRNVSVMRSGVAAVYSSQTGASITTYDSLSGDDNIIFFKFTGSCSALILNPKIEAEHDPVFDLQFNALAGNNSQVTVVGGYANATVLETDLVRIDTAAGVAASVTVVLINFRKNNYTNIFNDIDNAQAYADADQSLEGIYMYKGKMRLYGTGSEVFLPYNTAIASEDSVEGTEFDMIKQGAGSLEFLSSINHHSFAGVGLSGAKTLIKHKTTEITCNGATETWTNAISLGYMVLGISARVTELITGATTIDIGDADIDLYIDGMAVALDTTADLANSNVSFTGPKVYRALTDVVVTGIGGAFTGGKLRLVLHYIDLSPPTS